MTSPPDSRVAHTAWITGAIYALIPRSKIADMGRAVAALVPLCRSGVDRAAAGAVFQDAVLEWSTWASPSWAEARKKHLESDDVLVWAAPGGFIQRRVKIGPRLDYRKGEWTRARWGWRELDETKRARKESDKR